ncbi:hypothetical protein AEAC466_18300 [Asticcacaulis sp. AC466]|uniref:DUF3429 domain-containing protein n=1 Tax=Asticcacaulis sp. AC466 TaxID=1282362 RepID=UPI0003C3F7BB|nr:DUF3429 domain-containing protein [Asticcacaulis sp. AC466]ESQ82299.1 hypothetical protein AEAC466_18300 [Asticcacaulis sp. AC466]
MSNLSAEPRLHPLIAPLTLGGALPFIGCAIGAWRLWPLSFDPAYVAVVYGAVILSFLSGIQWSTFLQGAVPKPWVIVASNLIALLGWVCVLLFSAHPAGVCLCLAIGFLFALWVDSRLSRGGFIPERFFRLRQIITTIVALCLAITAVADILI